MQKVVLTFIICCCIFNANAQKVPIVKYHLQLDAYFMRNKKLIVHLDTILPKAFIQLRSARLAPKKSKANYIIELQYKQPVITYSALQSKGLQAENDRMEKFEIVKSYYIKSYIILKDTTNKIINKFVLSDEKNVFEYKRIFYKSIANQEDYAIESVDEKFSKATFEDNVTGSKNSQKEIPEKEIYVQLLKGLQFLKVLKASL